MNTINWTEMLQNLLYAVVTAAVPVISYYVSLLLKQVFEKFAVATEQTIIHNTVEETLALILEVVSSTTQTYVDSLKKSGTFTEEAQKEAFNITKNTIMNLLSEESKDILETLYTDIDKWIDIQIESSIKRLK